MNLNHVLDAVRQTLPAGRAEYALHEPIFNGSEKNYVQECIESGWVSSSGKFVDRFEASIAAYTGARYVAALVNGTAALHMALKSVGVEPGDEVLVPDLTFVAAANAVSHAGAIPHFVDSENATLGVDPLKLERHLRKISEKRQNQCFHKATGRRLKALIVVHVFGHPADLESTKKVCDDFGIELIEDAAEALGSFYKGKHVGHWGRVATLSFNGNKICTTGGGGALLTNDEELAKKTRHVATTAKRPHAWAFYHDEIGYNYRMPNLNAAMGVAQLESLPRFLENKKALAERYRLALKGVAGVEFFREPAFAKSNHWLNTILLEEEFKSQRDELIALLNKNGIKARPAWTLMHRLPMYKDAPRSDVSVAENLEARIVNLPSSAFL